MEWASKWVGLPHQKLGRGPAYDCLGLYLAIYKDRHGVDLPDPKCSMIRAARDHVADSMRIYFDRVESAQEGDALMFRIGGHLLHVGYALDSRDMIHMYHENAGSLIERWNGSQWKGRLEGIYRAIGQ